MKMPIMLPLAASLALLLMQMGCSSASPDLDGGLDEEPGMDADGGDYPDGDAPTDGDMTDDADSGPVELAVTQVLPSRGPMQGGTWANILGSGFVNGIGESPFDVRDVTDVWFGDNSAIDIEVIRDDMISVRTPAGVAGPCDITVQNPNGRVTLSKAFDYYDTVRIDSLQPLHFSSEGATPFTITGTGFTEDTVVLFGQLPASGITVQSPGVVSGLAPPAEPGKVDVRLVNHNGSALMFRTAQYHSRPEIHSIQPATGQAQGGDAVEISGDGFDEFCTVEFDDVQAADLSIPDQTTMQATTPAHEPGSSDVRVQGAVQSDRLPGGFVYLDEAAGSLRILAVAPNAGPTQGTNRVIIAGDGFNNDTITQVKFGSQTATSFSVLDDRTIEAEVPAGEAGAVTVEVRTSGQSASAPKAYRYFSSLELQNIAPDTGPSQGGTDFTLTGKAFGPDTMVTFGGVQASEIQVVASTMLTGKTPPAAGVVDVMVEDADSHAVLQSAFEYTEDLHLVRVEPDSGAQAGGTYVTIFGSGFTPGMEISFGQAKGAIVQVLSPSMATARTPAGVPGEVDVTVRTQDASDQLPAGFSYFDPTNDRGGASGGPMNGSINITCLEGSWANWGAPVPDATVIIDTPSLVGYTDDRGQITFSGPSLVRAVTVSIGKEGFESMTVAGLDAANLTVYLYPNEQEPIDPTQVEVTYSSISGRVFGFKDIPGLPTGPNISYEARIYMTSYSIYSVPPYGGEPRGTSIVEDGGAFQFAPLRLGQYSIYALYGALNSDTDEFTPALLGTRRAIELISEDPVQDQDVVLSTPLDKTLLVHLVQPPLGDEEKEAQYGAYVSLDLGADGIIYLGHAQGTTEDLILSGLPSATADAFLFVGLASKGGSYPLSYTFRRQAGDLSEGVQMGPFLGFTTLVQPEQDGELSDGMISWQFDGPTPELTQVLIQTSELMPKVLWRVVLPGDITQVRLPPELLDTLPQGEPLLLLLYTANSPRFTFDRFNYGQLSSGRWTSYTVNYASITAP